MTPRKLALLLVVLPLLVAATWVAQDPFPDPFRSPPVPLATLTVTKTGNGSGTVSGTGIDCGSDCTQTFNRGVQLTLTATATTGVFTGWSGACTGTESCVVTMSQAQTVTATFVSSTPPAGRELAAATLEAQGKFFCHRTFRAAGWMDAGSGIFWRETDQDTSDGTLCGLFHPRVIYSTIGTPTVGVGPTGLPTLSITGRAGLTAFETLGDTDESQLTGRIGMRMYLKWSNDNACEAAKAHEIGAYWSFHNSFDDGTLGGGMAWQGAAEPLVPAMTSTEMRQGWWRVEIYLDPGFPGADPLTVARANETIFMTRITDSPLPTKTRTVTTFFGEDDGYNTDPTSALFGRPLTYKHMQWNHTYRDQRIWPGTCTNQYAYLLVGKNLASGERIPVACEIEGGC